MVEKIKEKKRRKILVTGSSGMLGVDLCRELSSEYEIVGLDIQPSAISHQPSAEFVKCDITDRNKTVKSIVSAKPDLVIHTAAWTDVDGCEKGPEKANRINKDGTENVVAAVSNSDRPLLYISTDFVFDGKKKQAYKEEDPANPINIYGRTKLEGENAVTSLRQYIILRTSWMYGANGKNFVDTILGMTKIKKELKVVDDQMGSPTYTKDLVKAIGKLLKLIYGQETADCGQIRGIYHISNKGMVSWFDYAKEILKIVKVDYIRLLPIKSKELNRLAKRPAFSVLDNTKFEKMASFTMRSWQEALREYINEATIYGTPTCR